MRFALLVCLLLMGISPSAANYINGHMLAEWCQDKQTPLIQGYVTGVVDRTEAVMAFIDTFKAFRPQLDAKDAAVLSEGTELFCVPARATVARLSEIVCQRLQRNPADRNLPAQTVVTRALQQAYPCPAGR